MEDFWSFDKDILRAENTTANGILKEQADLLTQKTDSILQGKVKNYVLTEKDIALNIETAFEIVVPNLDNYTCILFYVYSKAEQNFPIIFSRYKMSKEENQWGKFEDTIHENDIANDDVQFKRILKEVLGSSETNEKIKVLYQKAASK